MLYQHNFTNSGALTPLTSDSQGAAEVRNVTNDLIAVRTQRVF